MFLKITFFITALFINCGFGCDKLKEDVNHFKSKYKTMKKKLNQLNCSIEEQENIIDELKDISDELKDILDELKDVLDRKKDRDAQNDETGSKLEGMKVELNHNKSETNQWFSIVIIMISMISVLLLGILFYFFKR